MRTMGGLAKYMPQTNITFFIATLAIAGIPPLAGFWSKDEILARAFEYGYNGNFFAYFVFAVGLVTALLTGFYMIRADRKSTRLNSSHVAISYAVFCLKKKKYTTLYRNRLMLHYILFSFVLFVKKKLYEFMYQYKQSNL